MKTIYKQSVPTISKQFLKHLFTHLFTLIVKIVRNCGVKNREKTCGNKKVKT